MKRIVSSTAVGAVLLLAAVACGGGGDTTSKSSEGNAASGGELKGESIQVAAVWTGDEQKNFEKVLNAFSQKTGAEVTYSSTGDNIATVLGAKVKGGDAPDVALLPQPGLLTQFAEQGALKPASSDVEAAVEANYAPVWKKLGTVDGTFYGVWFDASNKSTVWYNTGLFEQAGVQPPQDWDGLLQVAKTLSDSGVSVPVSLGAADGWTLTDWFENIYLRTAGPDMYDKLAKHEIKWTDPSVKKALQILQQLFADRQLVGDPSTALQTDFPTSVTKTFTDNAKSAIVYEGSFVATAIEGSTKAKVGTDAKFFPFPSVDGSGTAVVGGGDVAVAFKDTKGAMALLQYLATPEAAKLLVEESGFASPNKNLDLAAYPTETNRKVAQGIIDAGDSFRFDMSDQAPSAFGSTKGAGEWKDLQDFLRKPADIDAAMKQLEADAAKAYK